jgi:hypothetical protein
MLTDDSVTQWWSRRILVLWEIDAETGMHCFSLSSALLVSSNFTYCCLFLILKRGNFRCTQQSVGVENQLQHLASIIQVLDPKLHDHLGM